MNIINLNFFFEQTNEFVFSCSNQISEFTIIKLRDGSNITIINKEYYSSPNFKLIFYLNLIIHLI